jgi:hypothetical protein
MQYSKIDLEKNIMKPWTPTPKHHPHSITNINHELIEKVDRKECPAQYFTFPTLVALGSRFEIKDPQLHSPSNKGMFLIVHTLLLISPSKCTIRNQAGEPLKV